MRLLSTQWQTPHKQISCDSRCTIARHRSVARHRSGENITCSLQVRPPGGAISEQTAGGGAGAGGAGNVAGGVAIGVGGGGGGGLLCTTGVAGGTGVATAGVAVETGLVPL